MVLEILGELTGERASCLIKFSLIWLEVSRHLWEITCHLVMVTQGIALTFVDLGGVCVWKMKFCLLAFEVNWNITIHLLVRMKILRPPCLLCLQVMAWIGSPVWLIAAFFKWTFHIFFVRASSSLFRHSVAALTVLFVLRAPGVSFTSHWLRGSGTLHVLGDHVFH